MTKKIVSLIWVGAFAAAAWACGGSEPPTNAPAPAPAANRAATNAAPATNANANTAPAAAATALPADVKELFGAKCSACHGADAKGGPAAPNLFTRKDKHSASEWEAYLKNTKIWEKGNRMPVVPLSDDERKKLGAWLATAVGSEAAAAPAAATPESKNTSSMGTNKKP